MSLESVIGGGGGVAPLQFESWHELRVKADPDSWLPPYPLHNTNFFFKFVHDPTTASCCLILTDLCFVWLRRLEASDIDADMKRFNPSIRKKSTNHTISMIEQLLRQNNAQQFHLVRLVLREDDEDDDDDVEDGTTSRRSRSKRSRRSTASSSATSSAVATSASIASSSTTLNRTPSLELDSCMSLGGMVTFKWRFSCHSYGGFLDQCTFLRNQMYVPLHEMIKILSFQYAQERRKNISLMQSLSAAGGSAASAAAAAAAAGGVGVDHAHKQDVSLSLSLPSLPSAEREAQLATMTGGVGAGAGADGAALSFDAFNNSYEFSRDVGALYVTTMNRLSGNEDASGVGLSQMSEDYALAAQRPVSPLMPEQKEAETKGATSGRMRMSAAERLRGMKRDRSRSRSPSAGRGGYAAVSSTGVAAAAAHHRGDELDYKHADSDDRDLFASPSFPPPSHSLDQALPPSASMQSSIDIGGGMDDEGVYHESEAERMRREMLQRQLSAQRKRKKKKAFV